MGLLDWFKERSPAKPQELPEGVSAHDAGGPEFIGPQQGAAANLLHAELRPALSALPQVQRAYFCKLQYPGAERPGAAVCVVSSTGEDIRVVEAVAAVIRANLGSGSHIDILFLSPSLEVRLSSICQPFYKQAEPDAAHQTATAGERGGAVAEGTANALFRCPLRVRPGPGYNGPATWLGAFVDCLVAAPDRFTALRMAAGKLAEEGWQLEDLVDGKVDQLDPRKWDEHVASMWSELRDHLLTQDDVLRLVQVGGVYFGPFCGWESGAEPGTAPDGGGGEAPHERGLT